MPGSLAATARPTEETVPQMPVVTGPSSPRSRASTQPALPALGRSFGPSSNAGLSTVIAEPTPAPTAPRGFAAPPEARTMALTALADDEPPPPSSSPLLAGRGLPASFEAVLGGDELPSERDLIARGATVPVMDAVAPELQTARVEDSPTYRAPFVDPLKPVISLTPLPMLSAPFPSGSMKPVAAQPFPSGELLVPPHGTPPGTAPSASAADSLPAHLIGLPPSDAYPRYDGSYPIPKLQRGLPGWIIPVAISVAAAVVIGIVASLAG